MVGLPRAVQILLFLQQPLQWARCQEQSKSVTGWHIRIYVFQKVVQVANSYPHQMIGQVPANKQGDECQ